MEQKPHKHDLWLHNQDGNAILEDQSSNLAATALLALHGALLARSMLLRCCLLRHRRGIIIYSYFPALWH